MKKCRHEIYELVVEKSTLEQMALIAEQRHVDATRKRQKTVCCYKLKF